MGLEGSRCGSALSKTDYAKDNDNVEAAGNQLERFSLKWGVATEGFCTGQWYNDNDF